MSARTRSALAAVVAALSLVVAVAPATASDGTFLAKWGSFGTGDGQFNSPADVATDAAGNVYVADPATTGSRSSTPPAPS